MIGSVTTCYLLYFFHLHQPETQIYEQGSMTCQNIKMWPCYEAILWGELISYCSKESKEGSFSSLAGTSRAMLLQKVKRKLSVADILRDARC